jgi:hypothetical protein
MKKVKEVVGDAVVVVSSEELTEIRESIGNMDKLKMELGTLTANYELQKSELLSSLIKNDEGYKGISKAIFEKYGNVQVQIETGVVTNIKES